MPALYETILSTLDDTKAFAQKLAKVLKPRDVVLLEGNLGVGKTALSKFLLQALGADGEMPSPTFTLVQIYDVAAGLAYHFDFYRLKTPDEIEEIGFDEACVNGIVIVEWAEKARMFMPRSALTIKLDILGVGPERTLAVSGSGAWGERLKGGLCAN